jgi:hypothetical protein
MMYRKRDRVTLDRLVAQDRVNETAYPLTVSLHGRSRHAKHIICCGYCYHIGCEEAIYELVSTAAGSKEASTCYFPSSSTIPCPNPNCKDVYCSTSCRVADHHVHSFLCTGNGYSLSASFRSYIDKYEDHLPLDLAMRTIFAVLVDLNIHDISDDLKAKLGQFLSQYPCPSSQSSSGSLASVPDDCERAIDLDELIAESYSLLLGLIVYEKVELLVNSHAEISSASAKDIAKSISEALTLDLWTAMVSSIQYHHIKLTIDSPFLDLASRLPNISPSKLRHQLYYDHIHPIINSVQDRSSTMMISGVDKTADSVALERHISNLLSPYLPYASKLQEDCIEVSVLHPYLSRLQHSCVANLSLDLSFLSSGAKPSLEAMVLRDIEDDGASLAISWASANGEIDLKKRWQSLRQRYVDSSSVPLILCECSRCQYDSSQAVLTGKRPRYGLAIRISEVRAIAEQMMMEGKGMNLEAAELWRWIIDHAECDNTMKADACNALGACYLAVHQWQRAHEIWRQGASQHPNHSELAQQVAKLRSYEDIRIIHSDLCSPNEIKPLRIKGSSLAALSSAPWLTGTRHVQSFLV